MPRPASPSRPEARHSFPPPPLNLFPFYSFPPFFDPSPDFEFESRGAQEPQQPTLPEAQPETEVPRFLKQGGRGGGGGGVARGGGGGGMGRGARGSSVQEQLAQLRAEEGAMADLQERLGATMAAMRCAPPCLLPPPPPPPPPLPCPRPLGPLPGGAAVAWVRVGRSPGKEIGLPQSRLASSPHEEGTEKLTDADGGPRATTLGGGGGGADTSSGTGILDTPRSARRKSHPWRSPRRCPLRCPQQCPPNLRGRPSGRPRRGRCAQLLRRLEHRASPRKT